MSKLQQLTRKHGVGNWRLIAEEGRAVFLDRRTNGDLANKYRSMTLKAQRRARRQAAAAAAAAAEAAAAPASAAAAAVAGGLPWYQLTPQQRPRAERGDSDGVQPRRLEYGWLEGDAEA